MNNHINIFLKKLKREKYSINTAEAYAIDLYQFDKFLISNSEKKFNVSDLCPEILDEYIQYLRNKNLKTKTLMRKLSSINSFLRFLKDNDVIQGDFLVTSSDSGLKLCEDKGKEISLHCDKDLIELMNMILQSENPRAIRDYSIIKLLLDTGVEISDLLSLNISDIDLKKKTITFGNKDNQRTIILSAETLESLQNYLKLGRPELTQNANENALYVSQWGSRITRQGIWQIVKKWGRQAGLGNDFSPRSIRHYAIWKMIRHNKSVEEIKSLIGHKNINSTMNLIKRYSER